MRVRLWRDAAGESCEVVVARGESLGLACRTGRAESRVTACENRDARATIHGEDKCHRIPNNPGYNELALHQVDRIGLRRST